MVNTNSSLAIIEADVMAEGSGARVKRLFPTRSTGPQDPFVLLDEFFVDPSAGFPEHPHGGFEALTIMLEGKMRHEDSTGSGMEIGPGDVQRFTAGKGIVHSEVPGSNDQVHGFQLWINLPERLKKVDPTYQVVKENEFPVQQIPKGRTRRIAGPGSPVGLHTPVEISDVRLDHGAEHQVIVPQNYRGVLYVYEGILKHSNVRVEAGSGILIEPETPLSIRAESKLKFLAISGTPLRQPIRLRGSFVE